VVRRVVVADWKPWGVLIEHMKRHSVPVDEDLRLELCVERGLHDRPPGGRASRAERRRRGESDRRSRNSGARYQRGEPTSAHRLRIEAIARKGERGKLN
jgi:hypothetical protein